ncbi:MAG: STAS domain-containing protein [Velocimicrobium sp.]
MKETEIEFSTSITEINHCLIATIPGEMSDDEVRTLINRIMDKVDALDLSGAVLDFSVIGVLDTYAFTAFKNVSRALNLMGIKVIWAGLKPGVICALIDLNIAIDDSQIQAALNLEHALAILKEGYKHEC